MPNFIPSDKVLYLKYPKLVNTFKIENIKQQGFLKTLNESINNIEQKALDSNITPKFDKKSKIVVNHANSSDNRKNKGKINKKNRRGNSIDNDDIFLDSNNNIFTQSSNKLNKYRKKENSKSSNINNISPDNNVNTINKNILINAPLSLKELAEKLQLTDAEIITYLFLKGVFVTINDVIDINLAKDVAKSYNFNVIDKSLDVEFNNNSLIHRSNNNAKILHKRDPIITIFGHVDHGKTTLLDAILKTNFAQQESGGITQSINGYEVEWLYNSLYYKLFFLDTPGHEAFSMMRLRGAKITDIALIVIAADDGLKPQTIESIKYILEMKLPYIIVINKVDKHDINILKVKEELVHHGIVCKEWGGDAPVIEISALMNKNVDLLLCNICSLSEKQSLTADPTNLAQGTVLESYIDKKQGILANIVIQDGTLKIGDLIVAGNIEGKVKNLFDSKRNKIATAGPSSIVQVLGFSKFPHSGILFQVFNNDKNCKNLINNFTKINKDIVSKNLKLLNKRVVLDNQNSLKQFKLILKTNTQGSLEAILDALFKIPQTKVQLNVISSDTGNISSTDIELALAADALIIGFNIDVSNYINNLVKQKNLTLKVFDIIYNLIDYLQESMLDLIEPEYNYTFIGRALVQTVFNMNKGSVAGCLVQQGKLKKMSYIKVYSNSLIVYEGFLTSLKRVKDDVAEVLQDNECGVMCDYTNWKNLDTIEAFDLNEKIKSL
uniref:Translation initiation factor IF-2, chloroplastic n=1 Tax=Dasya naccarioides TaxID=2007180 RepID=A0A1Z1MGQ1_9FLOR|nr:translation initiation factor 2 [Dasya naccarioides]ARW65183.1 translation initiation factor 2 [Dasya naccarioides]